MSALEGDNEHDSLMTEQEKQQQHGKLETRKVDRHKVQPHSSDVVHIIDKDELEEFWISEQKKLSFYNLHLTSVPDFTDFGSNFVQKENEIVNVLSVQQLDFYKCLLSNLNGIQVFKNLRKLDVFLNEIKSLFGHCNKDENENDEKKSILSELTELEHLDISHNGLRQIDGLQNNLKLKKLYMVNNKLKKIENLNHLTNLTYLELGSNRIRKIENIENLTKLERLWLGRNKITKLEGLNTFVNLKILSIQSNRVTEIGDSLKYCVNLEQLLMQHNGLTRMDEGLLYLTKLRLLDLGNNFIEKVENVENMKQLEDVWLQGNKISTFDGIEKFSKTVHCVYLQFNPIETDHASKEYQNKILRKLPHLTELDGNILVNQLRANKIESQLFNST